MDLSFAEKAIFAKKIHVGFPMIRYKYVQYFNFGACALAKIWT